MFRYEVVDLVMTPPGITPGAFIDPNCTQPCRTVNLTMNDLKYLIDGEMTVVTFKIKTIISQNGHGRISDPITFRVCNNRTGIAKAFDWHEGLKDRQFIDIYSQG